MSADNGRARIRKAAAELFGERGFHDVTVREIAEIAEVSPALVIKLFGSKAELYTVANTVTVPLADLDLPRERLGRAMVQQILNRREDDAIDPWETLVPRIRQSPTPEITQQELREKYLNGVAQIIGDTTENRRHASAVACQLLGLAEGIRVLGYFPAEEFDSDDVVEQYASAVQVHIDRAAIAI
ncbi:TetR/AcrR family transcriptional regulator [Arthrobacter sp. MYb213]|uniref:TetR/AcrR family transcriptional regulator n=1 Tax=Arthrobacter sp. MYb213 TaxID=1848595 RepID=UPI000CFBD93F|nr:TetR/AcrR family transcriptional regulator [Arthrobacter sp. MYb213]PRB67587.1 TetR family transcriptional regulator [Arthrobacter sp. MYb213]